MLSPKSIRNPLMYLVVMFVVLSLVVSGCAKQATPAPVPTKGSRSRTHQSSCS